MAELNAFNCSSCKQLPNKDVVFRCSNKHIYCPDCAVERKKICKCTLSLKNQANPLKSLVEKAKYDCKFKKHGCTWTFTANELKKHIEECKYLPWYSCVGNLMNIWKCTWQGSKCDIEKHLREKHEQSVKFHDYQDNIQFRFRPQDYNMFKRIHCINAFNKTFVLYYQSDNRTQKISIIIFLLGRKIDASKYLYDLAFLSPENNYSKIKFTFLQCFNDTENIQKLIEDGKCAVLPYNLINNYTDENLLSVRFRLAKKEDI